jgi:hypothetical protein
MLSMGRRLFGGGALAGCAIKDPYETIGTPNKPGVPWHLIGESELIVVGAYRLDEIYRRMIAEWTGKFWDLPTMVLPVEISQVLKGDGKRKSVGVYYNVSPYFLPAAIEARDRQQAVFFLQDNLWADDFLFVGNIGDARASLAVADPGFVSTVTREIGEQRATAAKVAALLAARRPPFDDAVGALLDLAVKENRTQEAFERLRALERRAIPALVHHIDDRRTLATTRFTIAAPHPDLRQSVPDAGNLAMCALACRADVRGGFGWASDEAPDEMRQTRMDAWRAWLGYATGLGA